MKPRKLFVTSDWHLDAVTAGVPRFDEVAALLDGVFNRAIVEKAGLVFNGDLCDPDAPSAHRFIAWAVGRFCEMRAAGVPSLWVTGNHDVVEDGHCTSTLDALEAAGAVVVRAPAMLEWEGWQLGLLPYTPKTHAYDPAAIVDHWTQKGFEPQIVFGHLNSDAAIKGSESHAMPRGRDMNWPLEMLKQRYPGARLIGGHYHAGGTYGSLEIIGAPARFSHGESNNEPAYLEVNREVGPLPGITRHKFASTRRVYSVPMGAVPAVQTGDIVRVLVTAEQNQTNELHEFLTTLGLAGAVSVRAKQVDNAESAPIDLVERPTQEGTNEDGFAAAKRLAIEWPKADEEFRAALVGLVEQVGEQSR